MEMARAKQASRKPAPTTIHSLIATLDGVVNPQAACVLFAIVPTEIRVHIFSLAVCSYDDVSRPYPEHAFRSRPIFRFRQRICTNLLVTCKRIYAEAHTLPISMNRHIFWNAHGDVLDARGYPDSRRYLSDFLSDDLSWCFHKFTVEQKAAIVDMHLFVHQDWLDSPKFQMFCQFKDIQPKQLKLTIRPSEWSSWGTNRSLTMLYEWMDNFKTMEKLKYLEVELQTIEESKDELEDIVQDLAEVHIPAPAGSWRLLEEADITREQYEGHGYYDADYEFANSVHYSKDQNKWVVGKPESTPYLIPFVATTVRWTRQP